MNARKLTFLGIDATSGRYAWPRLTPRELAQRVLRVPDEPAQVLEIQRWRALRHRDHLGPKAGVDPLDLHQAGWAVVFGRSARSPVRKALEALLGLRKRQAGKARYREIQYHGEPKHEFLARFGVGPGPADPAKLPYYVLLVGSPEEIPWDFQHQLDLQYAVGRLDFDQLADYRRYAESVEQAETGKLRLARRAAVFAPCHPQDEATKLSLDHLARPLAKRVASAPGWSVSPLFGKEARKEDLTRALAAGPHALWLTAGHGLLFPADHERQRAEQGALVCQDWPGPAAGGEPLSREVFFAAADLKPQARVGGAIFFQFACFSGGTPQWDSFAEGSEVRRLASRPFLARLAQRLLSHPEGSALAVVGHVDRAFECSFFWPPVGPQVEVFASTAERLAAGEPVGWAMEFFSQRFGEISASLAEELADARLGKKIHPLALARLWTAYSDSRNYVVLGDPAARLPLAAPEERP
jgi:hypothetical protein